MLDCDVRSEDSRSTWLAALAKRLMSSGLGGYAAYIFGGGLRRSHAWARCEYELGGETLGELTLDAGADCVMTGRA